MAGMTIKTGKTSSVPQPSRFKFQHGQYPPSPSIARPAPAPGVKPAAPSTRDYGKAAPPLAGDTGMTGLS